MFGTTKRAHLQISMALIYFLVYLLVANQCLTAHSYIIRRNDGYQNQLENQQTNIFRQLLAKYLTNSESSSDDYDLQSNIPPTVQRRFCCMSPLSGRKRFLRDLRLQRPMPAIQQE